MSKKGSKKIILQSEKLSNVKYHGKPMMQYSYVAEKGVTNDEIITYLKSQTHFQNKRKLAKETYNRDIEFMVSTKLPQGWRSSNFNTLDDIDTYEIAEDSINLNGVQVEKQNDIRNFVVYMRSGSHFAGGKDKHNDCLWYCIKDAFGGIDKLPQKLRKARLLKKRLGLDRDDKIPISKLPDIEEDLNVSFTVTGDCTYVSKNMKATNIALNLHNEHYTLKCNENRAYTKGVWFKPVTKDKVYAVTFNDSNVTVYNGTKQTLSYDDFYALKDACITLRSKSEEDMKKTRDAYIEKADRLYDHTNGIINLYKYRDIAKGSLEIWRKMSKAMIEPEPIIDIEGIALEKAYRGGLHYAELYEGNGYSYDMNSMYLFYMSSHGFTIPTKQGAWSTMTTENFNSLKFFPYGIYRCVIKSSHKVFQSSKHNYYTHFDLELAKELKLPIELIQDSNANCLLYTGHRVNGDRMFGQFAEYMYDLKKKGLPVKELISSLWGKLTEKFRQSKIVKNNETYDISEAGECIDKLHPLKNGDAYVKTYNLNRLYKYNYARIGCFLTSYCRLKFARLCMPHIDKIVRINTDSMLTTEDISNNLAIGKDMGQFKVEHTGKCKVFNSNHVVW